jgi:dipeptidase E
MLVLCSNGLTSEPLLGMMRSKMGGCKTAALVVTADHEYKEKDFHVPRCVAALESLGLTVALFDLDRQAAAQLLDYDVVEFIGGNPYYLLNSIRKSNAAEVLKELSEKKILIGWSAAAFVFGPTLELVDRYTPEMNFQGLTDLRGLSLTEVQVLPHYTRYLPRFEGFEEKCRLYEQEKQVQVIRLDDGEGVLIDTEVHMIRQVK